MFDSILQYLLVIALGTIKVIPAWGLGLLYEMEPMQIFICMSIGGIIGVTFFTLLGERIRTWLKKRKQAKIKGKQKPLKIKRALRIVRIWNKFGLIGLAVLTPPMFSPPIGVIVAVALRGERKKILLYNYISIVVWAAIFVFLGDQIKQLIS